MTPKPDSAEAAQNLWKKIDEHYHFQIRGSGTMTTDGVKWIDSELRTFGDAEYNRGIEEAIKAAKAMGDEFMLRSERCCGIQIEELKEINKALGCKEVVKLLNALDRKGA